MYMLPDKMENSTFATQLCLKDGFRHSGFGINTQDTKCANCHSKWTTLNFSA